jgi:lipopolysaccharide/colanic/teichoic acid biosynthesis glycosyltransferase
MSFAEPHLHLTSTVLGGERPLTRQAGHVAEFRGAHALEDAALASLLRRCCSRRYDAAGRERLRWMLRRALAAQSRSEPARRAAECVLAVVLLIVLSPLLLLLGIIASITSGGPPLYNQPRHGRGGHIFRVHKFRTMYHAQSDGDGRRQATACDPRITRAGRIMRRWSLDELPQLLNVVKGEMSFVGPRPHPIGMMAGGVAYESLVGAYDLRFLVRPGITGLAQMRGLRGPTIDPARARMRILCDLAYIRRRSLASDLAIVLVTAVRELRGTRGS